MASVVPQYYILTDSCDLYLCKARLLCYGLISFALLEFSFVPHYSYWEKIFNKTNLIKTIEIETFKPVQIVEECEHFFNKYHFIEKKKTYGKWCWYVCLSFIYNIHKTSGKSCWCVHLSFLFFLCKVSILLGHVGVFAFPPFSLCV